MLPSLFSGQAAAWRAWVLLGLVTSGRAGMFGVRRGQYGKYQEAHARSLPAGQWLRRCDPGAIFRRLCADFSPFTSLAVVFAGQAELQVSHESIYQSLYVQGRGYVGVRLHRHLRRGRSARKPRGTQLTAEGRIRDKVMLSERPKEANDRLVAGHWEGDLIVGSASGSAIATLVERTTRFVVLVHLPNGHSSAALHDGLIDALDGLPELLRRSLTWDQGTELARHVEITKATGVPIFFCDLGSPWQRGSNENTNGLLRQYFPKGTDLNAHSAQRLLEVATELNERPRKTLKRSTPADLLSELVSRKEIAPVASTA